MKKSTLLEIFEKLEGDPDIFLWNDHTNSYQEIDGVVESRRLVQLSFDSYVKFIQEERQKEINDPAYTLSDHDIKQAKKWYATNGKWELNPWVTEEEINTKVYNVKSVRMLKAVTGSVGIGILNQRVEDE